MIPGQSFFIWSIISYFQLPVRLNEIKQILLLKNSAKNLARNVLDFRNLHKTFAMLVDMNLFFLYSEFRFEGNFKLEMKLGDKQRQDPIPGKYFY